MDKYARPVFNASETVHLEFGLHLLYITDLDETQEVISIKAQSNYVSMRYLLSICSISRIGFMNFNSCIM